MDRHFHHSSLAEEVACAATHDSGLTYQTTLNVEVHDRFNLLGPSRGSCHSFLRHGLLSFATFRWDLRPHSLSVSFHEPSSYCSAEVPLCVPRFPGAQLTFRHTRLTTGVVIVFALNHRVHNTVFYPHCILRMVACRPDSNRHLLPSLTAVLTSGVALELRQPLFYSASPSA